MARNAAHNVFINCAFDDEFAPGFQALVFAVSACGFSARCARELDDASETRIDKLYRIVEESRYGIHDLSRTELDPEHGLPRFNMPLELGIFLGAKRFGDDANRQKRSLVLDTERYRYQKFISDLAGMDIGEHGGDPRVIVSRVRDWLVNVSRRRSIPPTAAILDSYDRFRVALPTIASSSGLDPTDLAYADFERLLLAWLKQDPTAPVVGRGR